MNRKILRFVLFAILLPSCSLRVTKDKNKNEIVKIELKPSNKKQRE